MKTNVPTNSDTASKTVTSVTGYPSSNKRSPRAPLSKKPVTEVVKSKVSRKAVKVKPAGPGKQKLVRDSFTIPETEYQILADTKKALIKSGIEVKKTELIRVGLLLIKKTSLAVLKRHLDGLQKLKSGRPKKK